MTLNWKLLSHEEWTKLPPGTIVAVTVYDENIDDAPRFLILRTSTREENLASTGDYDTPCVRVWNLKRNTKYSLPWGNFLRWYIAE